MKLLITGGAGFIGSECLRQALQAGHQVSVLDKLSYAGDRTRLNGLEREYRFVQGDIANRELVRLLFREEKFDAVIHLAAESHVDRSILDADPFIETNVRGTQVLLDEARLQGIEKFINIATDEVYGELGADGEFHEDSPLCPNSPYAVSKTAADMLGRALFRTYGLPVVTLRPSNNYGPWQYPEKLLPVVIYKACHGEKIPIYGRGANVREWLHVSDCVRAILLALDRAAPGSVYNIGSQDERTNLQLVEHVLGLLQGRMPEPRDGESPLQFVADRPGHDFRYRVNTDKIRRELGWSPQVSFAEGMRQTVDWYREQMSWVEEKIGFLSGLWHEVYR